MRMARNISGISLVDDSEDPRHRCFVLENLLINFIMIEWLQGLHEANA